MNIAISKNHYQQNSGNERSFDGPDCGDFGDICGNRGGKSRQLQLVARTVPNRDPRVNNKFNSPTRINGEIAMSGFGKLMLSGVSGSLSNSVP